MSTPNHSHPDKNQEEGAAEKFRAIANAYEVLSDPETRENYDYSLEHPEEVFSNRYRYYQFRYKQANVSAFLCCVSF